MIWPDTPLYKDAVDQLITNPESIDAELHSTTKLIRVTEWKADRAILIAEQHTYRTGGGFYLDNVAELNVALFRNEDKSWQVIDMTLLEPLQYVNTEQVLGHEADVPENVKADILAMLAKQELALQEGDAEAYIETLDPNMEEYEYVNQQFLSRTEPVWKVTDELTRIVGYSGDKAFVYMIRVYEPLKSEQGTEITAKRYGTVVPVIRTESGKWVTTDGSIMVIAPPDS